MKGVQAAHPALRRRPLVGGAGDGQPRQSADVRARRRRRRARSGSRRRAGFNNLLTFDMGGTSTDVALIENGVAADAARDARRRRHGARALDRRAHGRRRRRLDRLCARADASALRVGPQSAGAVPGPAAYRKGGEVPTVTDANVVLGYLPVRRQARRRHDDRPRARRKGGAARSPTRSGMSLEKAAEGIVNIVNENMCGALRLVSVEQGYDPRDFALIAFGGAGPLHANALAKLINSWPVIVPPGPGVLCAYGDATTRLRNEASRTLVQRFETLSDAQVQRACSPISKPRPHKALAADGVDVRGPGDALSDRHALRRPGHEADGRHAAGRLPRRRASRASPSASTSMHEQLFTFALDAGHELVGLRAVALGPQKPFIGGAVRRGGAGSDGRGDRSAAASIVGDGWREATIYDARQARSRQPHRRPGDRRRNGRDHADPARPRRRSSTSSAIF